MFEGLTQLCDKLSIGTGHLFLCLLGYSILTGIWMLCCLRKGHIHIFVCAFICCCKLVQSDDAKVALDKETHMKSVDGVSTIMFESISTETRKLSPYCRIYQVVHI